MINILICISQYFDIIYLINFCSLCDKNVKKCFLFKNHFNNEDIENIYSLYFNFEIVFVENLDEIDDVSMILVSKNNKNLLNKIKKTFTKDNIFIIEVCNSFINEENKMVIPKNNRNCNLQIKNILCEKTIILIGGISNENLQLNFEYYLRGKFINKNINAFSILSDNPIIKSQNIISYEEFYDYFYNFKKIDTDLFNLIKKSEVIIIGYPGNVLEFLYRFENKYISMFYDIKPDCFTIVTPKNYNYKIIDFIEFTFGRHIDCIVNSGYNQYFIGDHGQLSIPCIKIDNINDLISNFHTSFTKILKKISLPDSMNKYHF